MPKVGSSKFLMSSSKRLPLANETHTRADFAAMFTDAMGGNPLSIEE
jgi:hypothetical protein